MLQLPRARARAISPSGPVPSPSVAQSPRRDAPAYPLPLRRRRALRPPHRRRPIHHRQGAGSRSHVLPLAAAERCRSPLARAQPRPHLRHPFLRAVLSFVGGRAARSAPRSRQSRQCAAARSRDQQQQQQRRPSTAGPHRRRSPAALHAPSPLHSASVRAVSPRRRSRRAVLAPHVASPAPARAPTAAVYARMAGCELCADSQVAGWWAGGLGGAAASGWWLVAGGFAGRTRAARTPHPPPAPTHPPLPIRR